jgi:hypothetical protein
MEVGKLILNVVKSKATMTLSVKPFGCMPSSGVSDGVQSLITEKFPGTIYCAVETSGDGAVNFYSRVQMYLFKAKQAAAAELEKALADSGVTLEQVRAFLERNPRFSNALHRAPHSAASTPADLVYEVAGLITKTPLQRALEKSRALLRAGLELGTSGVKNAPSTAQSALTFARQAGSELAEIAGEKAPDLARAAVARARAGAAKILPFAAQSSETVSNVAAAAG